MHLYTFLEVLGSFLYIDGTFLAGTNKGTLLVSVSQDGCGQFVLFAIVVFDSENSEI